MLKSRPIHPISSFNHLVGVVSKIKHYDELISMHIRMSKACILPDIMSHKILLNSFCCIYHIDVGFAVLGVIIKKRLIIYLLTGCLWLIMLSKHGNK